MTKPYPIQKKKKPKIEGIVALIISVLAGVILILDVLTTDLVNTNNIINITGHYKTVNKLRPPRGSLNYELFIQEDQNVYKIGADDADCFIYDRFVNEIPPNQPMKISVRLKNSLVKSSSMHTVVGVEAKGIKYLDPACINNNLSTNKVQIPLMGVGLMILGFLIYKFKR